MVGASMIFKAVDWSNVSVIFAMINIIGNIIICFKIKPSDSLQKKIIAAAVETLICFILSFISERIIYFINNR
jgi:hypothetical protein